MLSRRRSPKLLSRDHTRTEPLTPTHDVSTFAGGTLDDVHAVGDVTLQELGGVAGVLEEHLSVGVVGAQVGHVLERTWTRCEDNKTGENQNIFLSI